MFSYYFIDLFSSIIRSKFYSLVTLEGDRSIKNGLLLLSNSNNEIGADYFLLGDPETDKRYKASLDGDYLEELYYNPLYRKYLPNNGGVKEANETWIPGNNGFFFHTDEKGNLLGCSVCIADETLAGEDIETYYHFNLDGTLAGYSIPREDNNFITLAGVEELGFSLKGLKMPSFKASFKMPTLSLPKISLPKFKIPNISIPKLSIPKINIPKFKIPDIGKGLSNVTNQIGKGFTNVGNQIGKGVNKYFSNIGELATGAQIAAQVLDTGLNAVSSLLPGGQGMAQEQPQEEQQATDYTEPGYEDDKGYTASDGNYYLHDGTMYLDNQTGKWIDMQQSQTITDYTQPGYEDDKGYTASDGNYYLHDGSSYLSKQTGEWVNMADALYGVELGFDLSSLSSLASNPLVSMGLNTVLPGSGAVLPMLSNLLPGMQGRPGSTQSTGSRPSVIKPPPIKQVASNNLTIKPPPRQVGQSSMSASSPRSLIDMIPGYVNTPIQQPTPVPPKEDYTKLLMIGGGVVALGLIYKMIQNKIKRKKIDMSSRKPKKPKFPRKPKSSNTDTLERWVKKCEELRSEFNKKHSEWKKQDDKKKALIKRGEKAKVLA